jgi:hypothetical protein
VVLAGDRVKTGVGKGDGQGSVSFSNGLFLHQ